MSNTYLLRIEATNLDHFIGDSDDLSTIRGGGLRLLNSPKFLMGQADRIGVSYVPATPTSRLS